MENWRGFRIDEGRGMLRQETRDLTRAAFDALKNLKFEPETGFEIGSTSNSETIPAPQSVQDKLGIKNLTVQIVSANDIGIQPAMQKMGVALTSGGAYSAGSGYTAASTNPKAGPAGKNPWEVLRGVAFYILQGEPTIMVSIVYNPKKIQSYEDYDRNLSQVHAAVQKTIAHELWHHYQLTKSGHFEKYTPQPHEPQIPSGFDPEKAFWLHGDPNDPKFTGETDAYRYFASMHEVEANVRGFYIGAKKSKGKHTFESLIDDYFKLTVAADPRLLRRHEIAKIKQQWMEYARIHLPCATLKNGSYLNPEACQGKPKDDVNNDGQPDDMNKDGKPDLGVGPTIVDDPENLREQFRKFIK